MPLTIAITGAGSIGFTRRLVQDILGVPELADTVFRFHDLSAANLDMVAQLCRRDVDHNRIPARIEATTDRREAFKDADHVVCCFRHGGLEAFALDVEIPLKYGVDQCVGDTLCAGGLMYAQRNIAEFKALCADLRAVAKPGCRLFNYANPMAMNTWACNQHFGVDTTGLCHGVQGAHHQIAKVATLWARAQGLIAADAAITRQEVDVVAAGLNHQTWFVQAAWRGHDLVPLLPEWFPRHADFARTEKVRIDVLQRFGYYSTESNGHLSEYLPWYRKRTGEIRRWIDLGCWIHGETGGYLRVCTEGRNWFEHDFPQWMQEAPKTYSPQDRSEEHLGWIIEALATGRSYRGHFNTVNRGRIANLPAGCVVEIPGYVDRTGIHYPVVGELPLACAATCSASARVQEMGVEAAVRGDARLLKQAMLHDPLVGAVCDPEEVWQMVDEMLVAQARWLPQYAAEIPLARKRLAAHERNGTRVKLRQTEGAARLHTKTVQEMAQEKEQARANAQAADKGKMTARA